MKITLLSLPGLHVVRRDALRSTPPSADATPTPLSGIDIQYFDGSVRPQDDFYKHINGKWLADTEIPAGQGELRHVHETA